MSHYYDIGDVTVIIIMLLGFIQLERIIKAINRLKDKK